MEETLHDEISWLTAHKKKDLGVWISNDFKASSHVAKGVSKANPDPFQGLSR